MSTEENELKKVFTDIYKSNDWSSLESVSGTGSEWNNVKSLVKKMRVLMSILKIDSVVDLGCGDYNWFRYMGYRGDYIGFDVVHNVMKFCRKEYGNEQTRFICKDIIEGNIFGNMNHQVQVKENQLVICRDVLVHLTNEDVKRIINYLVESGVKYFLTTTFPTSTINADIERGMWRPLNLAKHPFYYPEPVLIIKEDYKGEHSKPIEFDPVDFEGIPDSGKMFLYSIHDESKTLKFADKSMALYDLDYFRNPKKKKKS